MFRYVKLGVFFLDLLVDIAQRRRDLYSWPDREAQPYCAEVEKSASRRRAKRLRELQDKGAQTDRVLGLCGTAP